MVRTPPSVGGFLWKCMLPITLGNAIGGAVFVSAFNWYVFMHSENKDHMIDRWTDNVGDGEVYDRTIS